MHHAEPGTGEEHRGQRRAHALQGRVGVHRVTELLVGGFHGRAQGVDQRVAGYVLVQRCHGGDDHIAGHVAGGHATHAVGDGEQAWPGVDGILVPVPDQAAVTAGGIAERQGHGRNSRAVRPIRIGTPSGTGMVPETFVRSRKVPLVDPRSSSSHWPEWGTSRACRADA